MSKPRLLDAYDKTSKTITSVEPDYAIAVEWSDSNPDAEDRVGYFVSNDINSTDGIRIIKANESTRVLGVTVADPGFSTNVSKSMCDVCDDLLPGFSYVSIAGFAPVIDDGNCEVNGMCIPSSEGIAIPSKNATGYRVINRIDDNHILIHLDPIYSSISMKVKNATLIIE